MISRGAVRARSGPELGGYKNGKTYMNFFILLRAAFRPIHPSIRRSVFSFVSAGLFCWSVCLLVNLVRTCIIGDHSWKVWC